MKVFQMFLGLVITSRVGSANEKLGEPRRVCAPVLGQPGSPMWHMAQHQSPCSCSCTQHGSLFRAQCLLPASNAHRIYYLTPIPGAQLWQGNPAVHEPERIRVSEQLQMGPWEEVGVCLHARDLCLKEKNTKCIGEKSCFSSASSNWSGRMVLAMVQGFPTLKPR